MLLAEDLRGRLASTRASDCVSRLVEASFDCDTQGLNREYTGDRYERYEYHVLNQRGAVLRMNSMLISFHSAPYNILTDL